MGTKLSKIDGPPPVPARSPLREQASQKDVLAQAQADAQHFIDRFLNQIRDGEADQRFLPVSRILSMNTYYYCVEDSTSSQDIAQTIETCVADFANGPSARGVQSRASKVLTSMLAEAPGSQMNDTLYLISVDKFGVISRLDTIFYVWNFENAAIRAKSRALVASAVIRSDVDTTNARLDDATLKALLATCFNGVEPDVTKAIYKQARSTVLDGRDPSPARGEFLQPHEIEVAQ